MVEVTSDYISVPRQAKDNGVLWNDRDYQDMGDKRFSSRTQHRDYMRQHGLTTADDYKDTWRKNEAQRIKVRQGYDPTRRASIERAIHQLNSKGRK